MNRHFIVDLDRTLFATGIFAPRLLNWIEQTYAIEKDTLSREQEKYSIYADDLRAYDLFEHLAHHHVDAEDFTDKLLASEFANDTYLFEGARELLDECLSKGEVTILSFGPDDYQRLKYRLCPSIVSRAILVTTLIPKYQMIHTITEGPLTVIDDKPIGAQLPANVEFIQALPELDVMPDQPWPVYKSLTEIQEYIHEQTY